MGWADDGDEHGYAFIVCDGCSIITQQMFTGIKSAKKCGVYFVRQETNAATYCPECCVRNCLTDGLNSLSIRYTLSKDMTQDRLMKEAFEQAHQLTLKHWKTALFLPPPPLVEQPGVAVEELMEGWQAPAREYDQESQIVQHSHPTGMEESDRQRIHRLEARVHELECTVSQLLERLGEKVGIAGGGIHRLEERVHELECTVSQLLERLVEKVGIAGGGGPSTLPSINQQLKQACGA